MPRTISSVLAVVDVVIDERAVCRFTPELLMTAMVRSRVPRTRLMATTLKPFGCNSGIICMPAYPAIMGSMGGISAAVAVTAAPGQQQQGRQRQAVEAGAAPEAAEVGDQKR